MSRKIMIYFNDVAVFEPRSHEIMIQKNFRRSQFPDHIVILSPRSGNHPLLIAFFLLLLLLLLLLKLLHVESKKIYKKWNIIQQQYYNKNPCPSVYIQMKEGCFEKIINIFVYYCFNIQPESLIRTLIIKTLVDSLIL